MSRPTQTWRINSACAPALIVAALGSIWVGGSLALSHGYFNAGYHTLMLDAFRVELDRNMTVALVAMLLFAVPGAYLRRHGFTGKTMLLAGLVMTVVPVALSLWLSPEWRVFHTRRLVSLGTWWDDIPLPAALRHQELIIGTVLAVVVGVTVLALLGRKRSGPARPPSDHARQLIGGVDLRIVAPLALWALVHIASSLFGPAPAASPHHVIFLTWDSIRADHVSSYGHPRTTTPTLDSLANESVKFERAYAQNNWTRPSYASILTSQYNYRVHDRGRIRNDVTTVAEVLKNRGYHTVAIVQNPNLAAHWGFSQGFDEYYRIIADSSPEAVNALAIPRIQELARRGQPLFLFIHFQEPHWPYRDAMGEGSPIDRSTADQLMSLNRLEEMPANIADIAEFLKTCYENDIRVTDRAMGELLEATKEAGLYEESMIVFASDHGDEFHEHQAFGHGHDNLHPELTWVPLTIRFPDSQQVPAQQVRSTVSNLDIIPTILEVIGIEQPADMQGETLLPIDELSQHERISSCRYGPLLLMLRSDRYAALVNPSKDPAMQFFDLQADPGELRPLDPSAVGDVAKAFEQHFKARFASYRAVMDEQGHTDDGSQIRTHEHVDEELIEQLRALGYVK